MPSVDALSMTSSVATGCVCASIEAMTVFSFSSRLNVTTTAATVTTCCTSSVNQSLADVLREELLLGLALLAPERATRVLIVGESRDERRRASRTARWALRENERTSAG